MKIWKTIKLGKGVIEIRNPEYIILRDENGGVNFYKLVINAKNQPSADLEEITYNEQKTKKVKKRVKKMIIRIQRSIQDIYIEVQVVKKDSHTADVILTDYVQYYYNQWKSFYPQINDILLRVTSD